MRSATSTRRMHSAAAAYSAAAASVLHAGISAYWAVGGTALLTTAGNAVEPHARHRRRAAGGRMAHRRGQTGREHSVYSPSCGQVARTGRDVCCVSLCGWPQSSLCSTALS